MTRKRKEQKRKAYEYLHLCNRPLSQPILYAFSLKLTSNQIYFTTIKNTNSFLITLFQILLIEHFLFQLLNPAILYYEDLTFVY
jgi:hypothetical protein